MGSKARSAFVLKETTKAGPGSYHVETPKRTGFTFQRQPKHDKPNSSFIGPGHYDVENCS